jgi:hypothetical protein
MDFVDVDCVECGRVLGAVEEDKFEAAQEDAICEPCEWKGVEDGDYEH